MSDPSRRGFLKGIVGVTAGSAGAASAAPQAQIGAAIPMSQSGAYSSGRQRMMISTEELELLVSETLSELVARKATFTAFDVTIVLRRRHPGVNVMHPAVRMAVHRRMEPVVASRFYGAQMLRYPGGDAVRYMPM